MTTQTEAQYNAAKKKTAKATAKKKTAKKAKAKAPATALDSKLLTAARKALPAIRSGEVTVRSVWRDELKLDSIAPLRAALTEILGSKAAYLSMLKGRAKKRAAAS